MKPELIRFSSHPHAFWLKASQCDNLECECADVTFHLEESYQTDKPPAVPMQFQIIVDPETWQEAQPPKRSAIEADMVAEFLRDYPAEERAALQKRARKKKASARRLREYRFTLEDMASGALIPFSEIISDNGSISRNGRSYAYNYVHEGREYLVDDQYCTNPRCDCREVHLMFTRYEPAQTPDGETKLTDEFMAALTLDGKLKVAECYHCSSEHAQTVASGWWEQSRDELDSLVWSYNKVKEIARRSMGRSLATAGNRLPFDPFPAETKPGRNEPCPCGSGKKYKRCCGR